MSRKHAKRNAPRQRGGLPVDNAPVQDDRLRTVNCDAAGIDIGATVHFVAVPTGRDEVSVRNFGTYTADLEGIADWLAQCGVTTVAMESTGVYWIPLYELLEHRGFEVILSEPSQIKKVPGRKSDVLDSQWIQRLHSFGLLLGSFRPDDAIVVLRAYLRQRETLVGYAASHVQHMQKALEQMNVKLTEVISDITGLTGMSIIEAILAGQRDPETLAKLVTSVARMMKRQLPWRYRATGVRSICSPCVSHCNCIASTMRKCLSWMRKSNPISRPLPIARKTKPSIAR